MYAVICTNFYYDEIETAVNTIGSTVIYKSVGSNLNPGTELLKLRNIPVKCLIIDISSFDNSHNIIMSLKQLRLVKDNIRIILFMPGFKRGDSIFTGLINLGIYDFIVPEDSVGADPFILLPVLIDVLNNPVPFSKAYHYISNDPNTESFISESKGNKGINKIVEKEVAVEKEVIIGPVIIGVSGIINRIGTTYTVFSLASFLSYNYNVAVVELNSLSPVFLSIRNTYEVNLDEDGSFCFNKIRFFPYQKDFDMSVLMKYDFDYILLDLGKYDSCNKNEFWRSGLRIMVCGSQLWELSSLEMFFRVNNRNDIVNYLFSYTDDSTFKDISKSLEPLKCYLAPFNPQIFDLVPTQKDLYAEILSNILPKYKKKRGFFSKFKS